MKWTSASPALRQTACATDGWCVAWMIQKFGALGCPEGWRFLKSEVLEPRQSDCCVSGVTQRTRVPV